MSKIPPPTHGAIAAIDAHHESRAESPRYHLGASMLGHHCDRWLWLSFRWAIIERFSGRMLRLFRRGQMEEDVIASDLRAIGCDLVTHDENGRQLRVDFGCHVSGSMDGVILSGLPESPNKPHVIEMKTHSLKSFNDLSKTGVQQSKPMHYIQMQAYMHGTGVDRAFYYAVCKDNDEIYTERVRYDKAEAERYISRGKRIAVAERMPEPCSVDPTWYKCRLCPAHGFCHKKEQITEQNCRTCAHSAPQDDGTWHCMAWCSAIPNNAQKAGCERWEMHDDLAYGGGA